MQPLDSMCERKDDIKHKKREKETEKQNRQTFCTYTLEQEIPSHNVLLSFQSLPYEIGALLYKDNLMAAVYPKLKKSFDYAEVV